MAKVVSDQRYLTGVNVDFEASVRSVRMRVVFGILLFFGLL